MRSMIDTTTAAGLGRGANRPENFGNLTTAIVPERSPKGRGCERGREALQVQGGRRTEERGEVGGERRKRRERRRNEKRKEERKREEEKRE